MTPLTPPSTANLKPSNFKAYLLAARPKTLLAGQSPIVLGVVIALVFSETFKPLIAGLTLFCTLLMQVGTNYVNDAVDGESGLDTDERLGPARAVQQGWLTSSQMKWGYRLCFAAAFLIGLYLTYASGGLAIFLMGIIGLIAAYIYSAGPFPLSRMALGELTAFIFFGPFATIGAYYLQTQEWSREAFMLGLIPGLGAAALMAINNFRDRETDARATRKTLATLLTEKQARALPLLLILSANLIVIFLSIAYQQTYLLMGLIAPVLFLKPGLKLATTARGKELNQSLQAAGALIFVQTLLISLGLSFGS